MKYSLPSYFASSGGAPPFPNLAGLASSLLPPFANPTVPIEMGISALKLLVQPEMISSNWRKKALLLQLNLTLVDPSYLQRIIQHDQTAPAKRRGRQVARKVEISRPKFFTLSFNASRVHGHERFRILLVFSGSVKQGFLKEPGDNLFDPGGRLVLYFGHEIHLFTEDEATLRKFYHDFDLNSGNSRKKRIF